eukprot:3819531-Prymnesium_polylepis.2
MDDKFRLRSLELLLEQFRRAHPPHTSHRAPLHPTLRTLTATHCLATPRIASPRHATPRNTTPRHATPRHAT